MGFANLQPFFDCYAIEEADAATTYLKTYAVLYRMLELAEREQAYYLYEDIGEFKPSLDFIRSILNPLTCTAQWEQRKPPQWETKLGGIHHAGLRLKKLNPECELRTEELADILLSLTERKSLIESLAMPGIAKQKLRELCLQLQMSVEEYRFWGVEGIEVTFESATSVMAPFVEADAKGKPTVPWGKIINVIFAISKVLDGGITGAEHIHTAYRFLLPTASAVVEQAGKLIEGIVE